MKQALQDIMKTHNAVRYGNRLIYLKQIPTEIYGYQGYVYIGIDIDSRNQHLKCVAFRAMDDKMTDEESNQLLSRTGVFMILSSENMTKEEILPLYYTRQQIEQVFDIGKSGADLLPIRVQSEETLRGHLMLTFMATALLQSLQRDIIMRRSKKEKINAEGIFMNMRNQKCKVYQSEVIPQEPMKLVIDIYKLFKRKSPIMLPRKM